MTAARQASLAWVERALIDHAGETEATAPARAARLVAIAEKHRTKIEDVVGFILGTEGKRWNEELFEEFCARMQSVIRQMLQVPEDGEFRKLCPCCSSHVAHSINGVWRCEQCGRVN